MTNFVPSFPPLLRGLPLAADADPLRAVAEAARAGTAPGLIAYTVDPARLCAAVLFTPEQPLAQAMGGVFAVALGLADAVGSLAPPNVGVFFRWPDLIEINGGVCGRLRAAATSRVDEEVPDWLAIAVELRLAASGGEEPGEHPDQTTLWEEGGEAITAPLLIASWSRHMLTWINLFETGGAASLHAAWTEKCRQIGTAIEAPRAGLFQGLDEAGNMLVSSAGKTHVVRLTDMLEELP